jgi:hypothetical protein
MSRTRFKIERKTVKFKGKVCTRALVVARSAHGIIPAHSEAASQAIDLACNDITRAM